MIRMMAASIRAPPTDTTAMNHGFPVVDIKFHCQQQFRVRLNSIQERRDAELETVVGGTQDVCCEGGRQASGRAAVLVQVHVGWQYGRKLQTDAPLAHGDMKVPVNACVSCLSPC
jgi:hypothetical protein